MFTYKTIYIVICYPRIIMLYITTKYKRREIIFNTWNSFINRV